MIVDIIRATALIITLVIIGLMLAADLLAGIASIIAILVIILFIVTNRFDHLFFICMILVLLFSPLLSVITHSAVILQIEKLFFICLIIKLFIRRDFFTILNYSEAKFMLLFIFFAALSGLLAKQDIFTIMNFEYSFIKWILWGWGAYILLDLKKIYTLQKLLLVCVCAEVLLGLVQFFMFDNMNFLSMSRSILREDSATGTFGFNGAHLLGDLCALQLIYFFTLNALNRTRIWMLGIVFAFLGVVVSFTEIVWAYVAFVASCWIFVSSKIHKVTYVAVFAVLITLLGWVLINSNIKPGGRYILYLKDPAKVLQTGKVKSLILSTSLISEDMYYYIAGYGPGTFSSGAAMKAGKPLFTKYIKQRMLTTASTTDFYWASFTTLLVETGIMGTCIYYAIFLFACAGCLLNSSIASQFKMGFLLATGFLVFMSLIVNIFEFSIIMVPYGFFYAHSLMLRKPRQL